LPRACPLESALCGAETALLLGGDWQCENARTSGLAPAKTVEIAQDGEHVSAGSSDVC